MRKINAFILCMIIVVLLTGCKIEDKIASDTPNALIPAIMHEEKIYCTTGKQISGEVKDVDIVGEITSVIPLTQWPEKEGEANFGEITNPYAITDDGFVVLVDDKWTLFELKTDKENALAPAKTTIPLDNSQTPIVESDNGTTENITEIFDILNELEYEPYTCDGLPEYRLTAIDGTVYAINFSEKWVWRGNSEQAELSDELVSRLKELPGLVSSDMPLQAP